MGNLPSTPVPPPITEKNLEDQEGKVFMITGATSGIGKELAQILYAANAKVWIVARSKSKAEEVVKSIHQSAPTSRGKLDILVADFNDLRTIKPAVDDFLQREKRLDVLWNNAGIMIPPKGTVTLQKFEAQLGVNAIAPFLFTSLLTDILTRTAKSPSNGQTRVVWVSSSAAANFAPAGAVDMQALTSTNKCSQWQNYGMSKAASILQSSELARRYGEHGICSVAVDPGNLDTALYKDMPRYQLFFAKRLALKPAIYGAYTELFAGLSEDVSRVEGLRWVVPWGKLSSPREDIAAACKANSGADNSKAGQFWKWCEEQVEAYT